MQASSLQIRETQQKSSPLGNIPELAYKKTAKNALQTLEMPEYIASDSSDKKHFLSLILRKVLYGSGYANFFKSLSLCMSSAIPASGIRKSDGSFYSTGSPGHVQVHGYDAKLGYAWVKKCGNPLLCFTCAPKVRYKRAQEVRQACEWMLAHGRSWALVTYTAPHYADIDPVGFMDRFREARSRFKSGTPWVKFKDWSGYEHGISALEVTLTHPAYGIGAGAHIHFHDIWFFDHAPFTPAEAKKMQKDLLKRWHQSCLAAGIEIRKEKDFLKHGLQIKLPMAKGKVITDPQMLLDMAEYISDRAACEISPGIFSKKGKLPRHVSHFEYMALALTKYPQARPYMLKLMHALAGETWMRWTKGLKSLVGVSEKSDKDLLKEEVGDAIYDFKKEDWKAVDKHKLQRRLMRSVAHMEEAWKNFGEVSEEELAKLINQTVSIIKSGFDPVTLDPLFERLRL